MRLRYVLFLLVCLGGSHVCGGGRGLTDTSASPSVKLRSVDISAVRWTDGFWAERFDWCRMVVIPNMWRLLADPNISHAYENFLIAAGRKQGRHRGPKWNDGDFYKWLEAAAFVYATTHDEALDRQMDAIIETIGKAQRADGYLHTPAIIAQRQHLLQADEFRERLDFETYNLGHLMTCACTHYRATGKTNLLDIAKKAADFLYKTYQSSPRTLANNAICPSHYMGVVEMYRTTGDPKYLELAQGLIDIRSLVEGGTDDNQDRLPFRQQTQAVGHAVRANYLYAGAADVYAETGDSSLLSALEKIWQDVAGRKMYVTGATGALYNGASPDGSKSQSSIQPVHQAYGRAYQLPNLTAHNESCATVGFVLWNWRMLAITGQARYADLLELALYNAVLAAISLDGKEFFYTNPLARVAELPFELRWSRKREPYLSCFCCPPNIVRTIAETAAYAYSVSDEGIWAHLYGSNVLDMQLPGGGAVKLRQRTNYPWEGTIQIAVESGPSKEFSLFLRVPGWAQGARAAVNGEPVGPFRGEGVPPLQRGQDARDTLESGQYFKIQRVWSAGDRVELVLPMPVQLLEAHPLVEETRNQVAVRRGPIVYCLESVDLQENVKIADVAISPDKPWKNRFDKELLAGVMTLEGKARSLTGSNWNNTLYRKLSSEEPTAIDVRLIPYYAWGNRGDSQMSIWMPLAGRSVASHNPAMFILDAQTFQHHVDFFNGMEPENIANCIPNREAWAWMKDNVPFFECPDKNFEQIYYFRWWTFRKHLKKTPDGFVFTEFLDKVGHSGKYNTISCALGHHVYEGAWLRDQRYLDEYARFWYVGHEGGLQPHLHQYSNWGTWALYRRYLVNQDRAFLTNLLDAFTADYQAWVKERGADNGLFWQYDVRDGMEESISGGRKVQNLRPPLNCYMYANAVAISKIAEMAGREELAREYAEKAARLKSLIHELLWDNEAKFFKVRRPDGTLADVREEIGFIPWYFDLSFVVGSPTRDSALGAPVTPAGVSGVPRRDSLRLGSPSYALTGTLQTEQAWQQLSDPQGFKAPMGITTAERRHPQFRSHGAGTCEWDGAVWPFATSQTLVALANVLRNYQQPYVSKADYFDALMTYARCHRYRGKPYIGEYLDEQNGAWLKPDSNRSRYYNHATFCDLVISGLVGLVPREDNTVVVDPLVPSERWDWFCLDNVSYHGRTLTVVWDRTGEKYRKGAGLRVFADGREIARSDELTRVAGKLPPTRSGAAGLTQSPDRDYRALMKSTSQRVTTGTDKSVPGPVGLVGLGLMGMALAERLHGGGFDVWGYDIDSARDDLLAASDGKVATSAAEIASACGWILLSLPDSDVVEAVLAEMGPSLVAGRIIIDTSTGDPERAAAVGRRLAERGICYLDATISGSSQQVREGQAVVLAGGPAAAFDQCQDLFCLFARRWFYLGPCGSGSQMKLVSNLVLGLNRAALAEGLWLGQALGLDPHIVLTVLRESMAYSRIMDTKGEKMIHGDFAPQARLSQHHKDVRLMLQAAAHAGTDLPLTQAHARLLELAENAGYGAQDNSAIICAFEHLGAGRAAEKGGEP